MRPIIARRKKVEPNILDTPEAAERELLEILKERPNYERIEKL
jgi:hypothetical protein